MPPTYPNFFLIGAARSGTTALYRALSSHPEIYTSPVKEPWFFAFDGPPPETISVPEDIFVWSRERYEDLFAPWSGQPAIGEGSTVYLPSAWAARRIATELPHAKLIAVLRHPIERAYSNYLHNVKTRTERARTFERALALERPRTQANSHQFRFYRGDGFYRRHLAVYFDLFPSQQIRMFLYEDWLADPRTVLREIFEFLGVDRGFEVTPLHLNPSRALRSRLVNRLWRREELPIRWRILLRRHNMRPIRPLQRRTRRQLLDGYREDIMELQTLIGRDLSHWLEDREITLGASARPSARPSSSRMDRPISAS